MEASAKDDINVDNVFHELARKICIKKGITKDITADDTARVERKQSLFGRFRGLFFTDKESSREGFVIKENKDLKKEDITPKPKSR